MPSLRLAAQYAAAPKLNAYVAALTQFEKELAGTFHQMMACSASIDHASRKQLDALGALLGLPRQLRWLAPVRYFGFEDTPRASGFAEGMLYDEGNLLEGITELPNETYRRYLHGRIQYARMQATFDELLAMLEGVLQLETPFIIQDLGCMAVSIHFPMLTLPNDVLILHATHYLPRILGVRVELGVTYDVNHMFGFDDTPYAKGLGEENDPKIGAPFMENLTTDKNYK